MIAAREQILALLRERIVAYAASRLGRDIAEDLAQEALLVLETKYSHLASIDDLLPLCFQILRFKMNDFRRKTARRGEFNAVDVKDLPLADSTPDPLSDIERRQLMENLTKAIAQMSGRCREIFRMKLEGHNFEFIRKTLGAASINTIYTWDFRCRQALLERMGGKWK